jgi:hypothetical protein
VGKKLTKVDPIEAERQRAEEEARRKEHVLAVKELAFRDFLTKLVRDNARPMPAVPAPPRARRAGVHERHALLNLHDWHFEERVKPDGVLGLNSYDIPTACRRLHRVIHTAVEIKRDREAGGRFKMPSLTVGLLGDMVTGTLHGLERHSDAPNIVRAALACGDLIALALRDLAGEFQQIDVVGVVGNHGRLPDDRKVPTKDPTRSWDYLAYQVARRRLEQQRNVRWHLPDAYGVLFEVAGHQCYAAHGNFIPQSLGIVGYGIRRFASALAANLSAAGKKLKYAYFGHWHSSNAAEFAGIKAFVGPSLVGTSEYHFLSGGAVSQSAQEMHFFDRDLGHVGLETLYGDGKSPGGAYEISV